MGNSWENDGKCGNIPWVDGLVHGDFTDLSMNESW